MLLCHREHASSVCAHPFSIVTVAPGPWIGPAVLTTATPPSISTRRIALISVRPCSLLIHSITPPAKASGPGSNGAGGTTRKMLPLALSTEHVTGTLTALHCPTP